ncbi:MAG TPA: adenylate/guanylate cyclase domain-containing protein [Burkholderiales bacterium]|nr:adenylate/guanylate cyclase domain-containing protein [Burkholderiales bacterium]
MAVLFADISDSTSLYQKLGDAGARTVVDACLTLVTSVLPRYEGRLVKTIGDEAFCVFPSADLAVRAASEMQTLVASSKPGGRTVRIHIGLHYGSVLIEEDDIFGDTVNAAAYLTAVATAGQIITTEATELELSAALKSVVRPIFHSTLKGSQQESIIYEVIWRTDTHDITDVSFRERKVIPMDTGSMLVSLGDEEVRVNQWHPAIVVGREQECDLVVTDKYASRQHLTIKLVRTQFYLYDHSINGTYVTPENGEEVHVLRRDMMLDGAGEIRVGRERLEHPTEVIRFRRDRRSIFRPATGKFQDSD